MRVRMSIILTALLALLIAAPLVAAKPVDRASQGTLLLGFEGPLSGPQEANGRDMLRGTQLAVNEINKAGGILGLKIKLVTADDKADAATGVNAAKALIKKRPYAVIGPYNSSVGVKTLPMYEKAGILPVQLTSTDETTGMGVTVQPKNSQISPVEVEWITEQKPAKVTILSDDTEDFTDGMSDRLQKALSKQGVLVSRIAIDPTQTDFTAAVQQGLANNPTVVYVSTYYPQGSKIATALAASGTTAKCFMGLANQDPAFIKQAGAAASSKCVFSGTPTPSQFGNKKARAYVSNYSKAFGKTPGTWGIYTYDSVYLLANAMRRGGAIDVEATTTAILKTKNLAGATGAITIDPKTGNRPNVPIAILGVDATTGKFVIEQIYT